MLIIYFYKALHLIQTDKYKCLEQLHILRLDICHGVLEIKEIKEKSRGR